MGSTSGGEADVGGETSTLQQKLGHGKRDNGSFIKDGRLKDSWLRGAIISPLPEGLAQDSWPKGRFPLVKLPHR